MQCYDLKVSKGRDFTYNFGPWGYKEIKRIVFTIYSTGKPFIELRQQQQQSETALDWVELQLYTVMLLAHPSQPNSLYKLFCPHKALISDSLRVPDFATRLMIQLHKHFRFNFFLPPPPHMLHQIRLRSSQYWLSLPQMAFLLTFFYS